MTVYLKGSNVKQASPGDIVLIQGILIPTKKNNFRDQFDIKFDCHIEALKIIREKKKYV
jgi:DNA replicative helicase MCM subunit Mcm2 (Cdc46/Mcm family)